MTLTIGWVLVALLVCLAGFVGAIFSLLIIATRADEEYERLARQPIMPAGFQYTHCNITERRSGWSSGLDVEA